MTPQRALLAVCLLVAVAGLASVNDALLYTPDSARYLLWADALASGDGFADASSPEPSRYVVHAPLYPILLAPVALVFPLGVVAAKVWTLGMGIVLIVLVYRLVDAMAGPWVAALASLFLATHGLFLIYATQVLSEIPFAIALVLVVGFLRTSRGDEHLAGLAALVLALGAGLFLREVGVTLVAAVTAWLALHRRWKQALIVGGLCVLLYGLWFVRNELIVAAIEQPPLRNSRLFFTHLFTPQTASLLEEFAARVSINAGIYAGHLATFVFAPDFVRNTHGLVDIRHPLFAAATVAMPYLKVVFALVCAGLSAVAIATRWKTDAGVRLILLILVLYAGPILLYPINDVRFLFPVYVLMLLLMATGLAEAVDRWKGWVPEGARMPVSALLVLVLLFPSLAWASSYVENNARFAHDHAAFMEQLRNDPSLPDYYRKDIATAGAWIDANAPDDAVVLSRWKELALWIGGRHVIDVDPQLTPDSFDRMVRDYGVRYVATILWRVGIRENELQILYSSSYDFVEAARIGSMEILEVRPKRPGPRAFATVSSDDDSIAVYRAAVRLLRRGDPAVAESLLVRVEERMGRYGAVVYQQAVAKALAGRRDAALEMFRKFRTLPQAGSFVQQAWYHEEILDRLRQAQEARGPEERASKFHVVAVNYWELGYRAQCFRMLDSALAAQPSFFPALIFAGIFSNIDGDVARAREFVTLAEGVQSDNLLVTGMKDVLRSHEVLRAARSWGDSVATLHQRAAAFLRMDMREEAIADWLSIVAIDPEDRVALRQLRDTYAVKRRFGPARRYARAAMALDPDNPDDRGALEDIERRWNIP